jgi:uncharacterized membrane protein YgaE (UPF0421/DUF939 family)
VIKTVILGLILGCTLGVALAGEIFMRIGMQPATFLVVLAGLLIAALLLNRGIAVIAAAIVLTTTILQPDLIGLDRDLLLAALLLTVLYPIVSRIMHH